MIDDLGYAQFQKTVQRLIGVDLASYRQGQMRRRLDALVARVGVNGFAEYAKLLERDQSRLQEFRDYFTINVTEFFRDPDRFRYLESKVLPELLAGRTALKVWSAACSIGAEPYSVAILLKELAPTLSHKITATDVDVTIVDRARRANKYVQAELKNVAPARLEKAFTKMPDGTYTVKSDVRQLVDIKLHNLLTAPPAQGYDLILCRNVVIYFTDEAKATLYDHLVGALRPGGVLFVGGTEMVAAAHQLGLSSIGPSFYRKEEQAGVAGRPRLRMAAGMR
ncbi:MAG: protein-glutamate O-methyltransferase CheR [Chloroflexi bacterium]|nr:protein-glutamate O-methyltransferase CheR [Chloroflexota bacterium]